MVSNQELFKDPQKVLEYMIKQRVEQVKKYDELQRKCDALVYDNKNLKTKNQNLIEDCYQANMQIDKLRLAQSKELFKK